MYCSRHIWINPTFTHVDRIGGIQEYSNPGWSRVLQSDITMYDRCFSFSTIKLNFLCVCLWFRPRLQLRHCHQCTMAAGEHGRFCLSCDVPGHSDDLLQLLSGALWCTAFSVFTSVFLWGGVSLCDNHNCHWQHVCLHMQMEALSQLTVRQLAEVSTTPGQLTTSEQVNMVMKYVPDQSLAAFFDDFSSVPLVSIHHVIKSPGVFCWY